MSVLQHSAHLSCVPTLLQELENLRKQAEIIPQLMAECESVTEKLQVGLKQLQQLQQQLQSSSSSSLRGDVRRERSGGEDLGAHTSGWWGWEAACAGALTDIKDAARLYS